jgi:hypothetical protein
MDIITITILVVAVLALAGWGYGYYAVPAAAPATVGQPVAGPNPLFNLLGVVGLILIVAFVTLLATGWRFGLQVQAPG